MNRLLEQFVALIRRFPYCVGCAGVTLVLSLGTWYLLQDIDELETTHENVSKEGVAMLTLLVGGSIQRQELLVAHDAAKHIEDNLALESELPENNRYFYAFEEESQSHLNELHQTNSLPSEENRAYILIPYTLRVSGSYEQVARFLLALETGPRLVNITSFKFALRAPGVSGAASGGSGAASAAAPTGATEPAGDVVLDLTLDLLGKR